MEHKGRDLLKIRVWSYTDTEEGNTLRVTASANTDNKLAGTKATYQTCRNGNIDDMFPGRYAHSIQMCHTQPAQRWLRQAMKTKGFFFAE